MPTFLPTPDEDPAGEVDSEPQLGVHARHDPLLGSTGPQAGSIKTGKSNSPHSLAGQPGFADLPGNEPTTATPERGRGGRRKWVGPVLMLVVFAGSLWLLQRELRQVSAQQILDGFRTIPALHLLAAVGLTALNYLILIGYDLLGMRYIGHPLETRKVAMASFLGHAVGNTLGALLGGATVRYRLYSSWGLSGREIVKLVLLLSVTFWIGLFALAGVTFLIDPTPIPARLRLPWSTTFPLGLILSVLTLAYFVVCLIRQRVHVGRFNFAPPPWRLALLQFLIASLDLTVAAAVLYVLLPDSIQPGFLNLLSIFLLSLVGVFVAQVPGGLGVLELVLLVLLNPEQPDQLMGSLIAYRMIYFLLPLTLGLLWIARHEWSIRRTAVAAPDAMNGAP